MNEKSANVPHVMVTLAEDEKSAVVVVRGFAPLTVPISDAFRREAIIMGMKQAGGDGGALPKGSTEADRLQKKYDRAARWARTGEWAAKVDATAIRAAAEARAAEAAKTKLIASIQAMKLPKEQREMMIAALG